MDCKNCKKLNCIDCFPNSEKIFKGSNPTTEHYSVYPNELDESISGGTIDTSFNEEFLKILEEANIIKCY